jgi:hypothetical protein
MDPSLGLLSPCEMVPLVVILVRIHIGVDHPVPYGPDLSWKPPPFSGNLIRCQSNHDMYACSRGVVVMSGGDGMNTSS